jgi:GntR family transcriptional regulator
VKSKRPDDTATIELSLDHDGRAPLYRQIVDRVWLEVIEGMLEPGTRLPTVRQLAVQLGVHLDTVAKAYKQLEQLGVVHSRPGEGTFVGLQAPRQAEIERLRRMEEICRVAVEDAHAVGATVEDLLDVLREMRSSPKREEA